MKMLDAISKLDIPEDQKNAMRDELMIRTMSEEMKSLDAMMADFEREKKAEKEKTSDRLYIIVTTAAILAAAILIALMIYGFFLNQ